MTKSELDAIRERVHDIGQTVVDDINTFQLAQLIIDITRLLANIDRLTALAQNGQSAINTNKRLVNQLADARECNRNPKKELEALLVEMMI